jgi:hypothetical protein
MNLSSVVNSAWSVFECKVFIDTADVCCLRSLGLSDSF